MSRLIPHDTADLLTDLADVLEEHGLGQPRLEEAADAFVLVCSAGDLTVTVTVTDTREMAAYVPDEEEAA